MILFFKAWVKPFKYTNSDGNVVEVPGYNRKDGHRGVPLDVQKHIVDRYKNGESCPEIAASIGLSTSAVWNAVKRANAIRPHSEAMALRMVKNPSMSEHRGFQGAFHSEKNGKWLPTGSRYEFVRMAQLEDDPNVVSFYRCTDRIPYFFDGMNRHYLPDLEIKTADGSTTVEEIKPASLVSDPKVAAKIIAARTYYADKGKSFRVVTEDDIGKDVIKNFNWDGITALAHDEKIVTRAEKERTRQREAAAKKLAAMTQEERDERNRMQRERHQANKAKLTPEQMDERRRKNAAAQRASKARKKDGGLAKSSQIPHFFVRIDMM